MQGMAQSNGQQGALPTPAPGGPQGDWSWPSPPFPWDMDCSSHQLSGDNGSCSPTGPAPPPPRRLPWLWPPGPRGRRAKALPERRREREGASGASQHSGTGAWQEGPRQAAAGARGGPGPRARRALGPREGSGHGPLQVRRGLPWGRPPSLPSSRSPLLGEREIKARHRFDPEASVSPPGGAAAPGKAGGRERSLSLSRDLAMAMAAWRSALRRARRLGCGWAEAAGPPPPTEPLLARHGRLPPPPPPSRSLRTSAACCKNQAARVRVGKGDRPVSYEEAHPPHGVAHRKGWLSLGTSHLEGELGAAERAVEDVFVRRFIHGTFHGCLADQVVLKRRANALVICAVFLQRLPPSKFYFLIGYTEALLSFLYKCPVKMEVQTLPEKVVYKYL
ncbi:28S ribosomal protein S24, mitochondrial [Sceloporus undulatus]|uniref:28S ribosomal protein S24, mitochondrial n=1 Tax=Sceloporus undulatus TaxID=8520 RepID=UPI001C4ACCED|nr:28S ribosomal protein S24, mitochondrial [Sceloporus undulatus]